VPAAHRRRSRPECAHADAVPGDTIRPAAAADDLKVHLTPMLERFRQFWTNIFKPIANLLIRLGVSPDTVTLVGTAGVVVGALAFFPRGKILVGVIVITVFVFSDLIDGYMARTMGVSSKWGAFLDSTLDRLGDAAIFGGLACWFFGGGDDRVLAYVTLWALVMGSVTSYARAKAESLGMQAKGGIAERSDRLVSVLVMAGLSDIFDLPILLTVTLWALAVASTVTVIQRMLSVRRQALADPTLPT
jgi:phosphatidylinositol phosphate synthase